MKWLISDLEMLSLGFVVLPNVLFATYFIQNGRTAEAAIPFVLFYVMVKTTPYAMRSFGQVKNPYTLLQLSLIIGLVGAFLLLSPATIIFGAIIVGMGFANINASYLQLKDYYRQHGGWKYGKAMLLGIIELLTALVLGLILSKFALNYFTIEFIIIIILANIAVAKLTSPWEKTTPYTGPFHLKPLIPTLIIFLMTLGARMLKQTGNSNYIALLLAMWVIMLFGFNWFQNQFDSSRLWTFWIGTVNNFFLIYSLFYFDALGESALLYLAYAIYILAMIASTVWGKRFRQVRTIMLGELAGLVIALIPTMWTFLLGMAISFFFVNIINSINLRIYQKDSTITPNNSRFVRQIYYILGSIASQVTLISLLIITNYLFDRNAHELLAAYYQHATFLGLNWPLWLTRLATLGLIIVVMILLATKEKLKLHQTD